MFRQQDERSGCSSAEPYPLACQQSIIGWRGALVSSATFLQQVVDGEVLLDQRQAAPQGVSGLLGREPLETAMADAIVLAEITVDRLEAVVGLASDDMRLLAFGVSLPANNPLMSQSCSDIVEGGASRDDGVGEALVLGQHMSDPTVVDAEQLGEVAVGEQSTLLVGLLAEADGLVQQPLGSGETIDALLHVLGGGDVEEDGDEFGVRDALAMAGRVVDADGHPERLAVTRHGLGVACA